MGSPISSTMAEIFLQLENVIIKHLIDAKILSFYTRYVDDILLIYDSTRTNPDKYPTVGLHYPQQHPTKSHDGIRKQHPLPRPLYD